MVVTRLVMILLLLFLVAGGAEAAGRRGAKGVSAPKKDVDAARSGRYQLLPVDYTANDLINETAVTKKDLILLDTATGQMQICSQKVWTNVAVGKDISERKCLPFETYAEYPAGSLKGKNPGR